jgi:2-dehydro-3-deoxygluconokinase
MSHKSERYTEIDLIGIGECLVEFTEQQDGSFIKDYSGDVLNTLSAARRLGASCSLLSTFGQDPFLPGLQEVLSAEKIDFSECPVHPTAPNGVYFVIREGGRRAFHFLRSGSAARDTLRMRDVEEWVKVASKARALFFSAIPLAVMYDRGHLFELLHRLKGSTTIYFDLNFRSALWTKPEELTELLLQLATVVDHLLVTNDDHYQLTGDGSAPNALEYYRKLGFEAVVFRQGADVTFYQFAGQTVIVPTIPNVQCIDPTGAGDAFNAGFIFANERSPFERVLFANAVAASSLCHAGGRGVDCNAAHAMFQHALEQIKQ